MPVTGAVCTSLVLEEDEDKLELVNDAVAVVVPLVPELRSAVTPGLLCSVPLAVVDPLGNTLELNPWSELTTLLVGLTSGPILDFI